MIRTAYLCDTRHSDFYLNHRNLDNNLIDLEKYYRLNSKRHTTIMHCKNHFWKYRKGLYMLIVFMVLFTMTSLMGFALRSILLPSV